MSQNPAAPIVIPTMPACNHSTAPKFRSDQLRKLRRYFDELGHLFGNCQINSNEDKKKYAVRYLEIDSADLWETLPQYQAPYSYDDFVQAVFVLYPGASEERRWSMADVDTLIGERLRIGIMTMQDLGQYFRTYYTITEFLKSKG
jgi:hypothetical protein